MKKQLMMAVCISCLVLQGCYQKTSSISSATGWVSFNRTPLMINAQGKAGALRLYQQVLNRRGNRFG